MRNTQQRRAILAALAGSMVMSTANAGSVAGNGGATEVTQILNNAELLQQSAQIIPAGPADAAAGSDDAAADEKPAHGTAAAMGSGAV